MTEVCTPIIRFVCFLVATLSLFTSALEANAGVRITMADDLESGRHFLVISTIFNRGFDSFSTDRLDSFFLTRGEKYVESVKKTVKRNRIELDQRLDEIKAWLALEQSKRTRVHDWMVHFHKADYVYREMMNNSDHKRIQQE